MGLQLKLKPHEKMVVNGAVIENGDKRTKLTITNFAQVLREKDILQPEAANTPVMRLYYIIQMMLIDTQNKPQYIPQYTQHLNSLLSAIQNPKAVEILSLVDRHVTTHDHYKAISLLKVLREYEMQLLAQVEEQGILP